MGFHLKLPNVKFLQIEGSNWQDTPHSHEDMYQISIPLQGELFASLENRKSKIYSGNALLANPNSVHGHRLGKQRSSFIIVGFNREVLNQWAEENLLVQGEIQFDDTQAIFASDLNQQMREWLTPFLFKEEVSNSLTTEVESNIFHYFTKALKGSHQIKHQVRLASDEYINQTLEYIHDHYRQDIHIDTLAALAQQSKYHFIRSFKKWTKYSPYQYILFLRIEAAKDMLYSSTLTITQISYDLGFSNPSQFYRIFHQHAGLTPKQYRKTHQL
jgi:AraC family transcriptional regulator